MPDDFQAQPPPVPPTPQPVSEDRRAENSFRKPDEKFGCLSALVISMGFLAVVLAVPVLFLKKAPQSSTVATVKARSSDRDALTGTWVATAIAINGALADAEDIATTRLTIDPNHRLTPYVLVFQGTTYSGQFSLGETADPKTIDFSDLELPTMKGIYDLNGGTLTICLNSYVRRDEQFRPKEFTAAKGSQRILIKMKRQAREPW
jgi:uncharacterized protein (TIGR03067 family)